MKKIVNVVVGSCLLVVPMLGWAHGTGISTSPLEPSEKFISAEFTGVTSSGGGMGVQARYTHKVTENGAFDAGIGMAGGERSGRIFAGYDHEFFPDYENQPRFSTKVFFENSKEYDVRRNIIGVAPTIGKGFSFWGHEAFPFFALPYGISLDDSRHVYQTTLSANVGIVGKLPKDWSEKQLTANLEANIGLQNSFSGAFLGIAYPID